MWRTRRLTYFKWQLRPVLLQLFFSAEPLPHLFLPRLPSKVSHKHSYRQDASHLLCRYTYCCPRGPSAASCLHGQALQQAVRMAPQQLAGPMAPKQLAVGSALTLKRSRSDAQVLFSLSQTPNHLTTKSRRPELNLSEFSPTNNTVDRSIGNFF